MNVITAFIAWIFDPHPHDALRGDEAYLAESVDLCDLERRIRELDQQRVTGAFARIH